MSKLFYNLEINLLSDLCVGDGGVYNSTIDTDICYDKFGLPYIPAKRIRGCLRECAEELADWGDKIDSKRLFGWQGDQGNCGKIRIGNAYLKGYDEIIKEISNGNQLVYHPQNVLDCFSYIRTQTTIDEKTGVAEKNTLRTVRVANKGLTFSAQVEFEDDDAYEQMNTCCKIFRHMGIARTRGLGEITANLCKKEKDKEKAGTIPDNAKTLKYNIELLEPVVCKSINGGEGNSLDYIEGSKIIGLLAKTLKQEEFIKILSDKNLTFSNAYLCKDGQRLTELPAYIYAIKNNKRNYINRLVFEEKEDEKRQINGMKHCYVAFDENGTMTKEDVQMEERYHHSRPEDKSIGRATDIGESKFYQISSIKDGQIFEGYISGNEESIKSIYNCLSEKEIYLGYGKRSEYGKCRLSLKAEKDFNIQEASGKEFVITLHSPAIIYNEKAMYSTCKEDLLKEILSQEAYEKVDFERTRFFINYNSVGGFNVTWKARKPVVSVFDKGTAVKLIFKEDVKICCGKHLFIGERSQEGFGECAIEKLCVVNNPDNWKYEDKADNKVEPNITNLGEIGTKICTRLFESYIIETAESLVKDNNELINEKNRSTVSNMLLMTKECDTLEIIEATAEDRFGKASDKKKSKLDVAKKILKLVKDNWTQQKEGFCKSVKVEPTKFNIKDDEIKLLMLGEILRELKYQIRKQKNQKKEN